MFIIILKHFNYCHAHKTFKLNIFNFLNDYQNVNYHNQYLRRRQIKLKVLENGYSNKVINNFVKKSEEYVIKQKFPLTFE